MLAVHRQLLYPRVDVSGRRKIQDTPLLYLMSLPHLNNSLLDSMDISTQQLQFCCGE